MALTAETARAVLAQAKADETYEAAIPEDDEQAIFEATELVDQAKAAWEANIRGPEVEAILNLADAGDDGGEDEDGDGDGGDEDEDLSEIEPWEGYDGEKAVDVKAALDWSLENEPEDFQALARHVWEYESAKAKPRKGVIDYLTALAEKAGGTDDDDDDGEPEAEPEPDEPEAQVEPDEPEPEEEPEEEPEVEMPEPPALVGELSFVLSREMILTALNDGAIKVDLSDDAS